MIKKIVATIFLLLVAGGIYWNWRGAPPWVRIPNTGILTTQGMMTCLPHRSFELGSTMECLSGFKDDQGRYFMLRVTDPNYKDPLKLPVSGHIEIEGIFTPMPDFNEKYLYVGILEATKITKLTSTRTSI